MAAPEAAPVQAHAMGLGSCLPPALAIPSPGPHLLGGEPSDSVTQVSAPIFCRGFLPSGVCVLIEFGESQKQLCQGGGLAPLGQLHARLLERPTAAGTALPPTTPGSVIIVLLF